MQKRRMRVMKRLMYLKIYSLVIAGFGDGGVFWSDWVEESDMVIRLYIYGWEIKFMDLGFNNLIKNRLRMNIDDSFLS